MSRPRPALVPQTAADAQRWQTLLFVPQFAFPRVAGLPTDALIVDFQDAVPLSAKPAARAGLRDALEAGHLQSRPVIVRINERALPDEQRADLDALVGCPHVLHAELLRREADAGLPAGTYRFLVLVETPGAQNRIADLAEAGGGRVIGLMLGAATSSA